MSQYTTILESAESVCVLGGGGWGDRGGAGQIGRLLLPKSNTSPYGARKEKLTSPCFSEYFFLTPTLFPSFPDLLSKMFTAVKKTVEATLSIAKAMHLH